MDQYYNPLNYGFDYFFGLPYIVIKDFGPDSTESIMDDMGVIEFFWSSLGCGLLASLFISRISRRLGIACGCLCLSVFTSYYAIFKTMGVWNTVLVRNEEIIEMPFDMNTITRRLISEGQGFLHKAHGAKQPAFLMMSWLHVHETLHPQPPFQGQSSASHIMLFSIK
jgi:hypothetical protein